MTIEFEGALQNANGAVIDLFNSADGMRLSEIVSDFREIIGSAQQIVDDLQCIPIPRVDHPEIPGRYVYADVEG
jgi:hypothetical protein